MLPSARAAPAAPAPDLSGCPRTSPPPRWGQMPERPPDIPAPTHTGEQPRPRLTEALAGILQPSTQLSTSPPPSYQRQHCRQWCPQNPRLGELFDNNSHPFTDGTAQPRILCSFPGALLSLAVEKGEDLRAPSSSWRPRSHKSLLHRDPAINQVTSTLVT